jgi:hypothetical protein
LSIFLALYRRKNKNIIKDKMCLLPCWPCTDIFLVEKPKKKTEEGILVYDPAARTVVKVAGKVPVSL